jgi:hypothetical protein
MLNELIREIYETSSLDWANSEKVSYALLQYLEREMPPDDFGRIKRYVFGWHTYQPPPASGYPGYGDEPPDQARS